MKNKKIIVTILIVVILIISIAVLIKLQNDKKLTLCRIETYDEIEIKNHNKNKRAFKIEKRNSNIKVTVNGEEYIQKQGFYKPGSYEIKVTDGQKEEKIIVQICELKENERKEYNIYNIGSTLPTLFSTMNLVEDRNKPTYFWTGRADTLNEEKMKETVPNLYLSKNIGKSSEKDVLKDEISELKEYVKKVLAEEPNAYFHFYTDEFRYYVEFPVFAELGLTEERYDVTMYSDGTLSYVINYQIMQENSYDTFETERQEYEKIMDEVRSNKYHNSIQNYRIEYLENKTDEKNAGSTFNLNYILLSALRKNTTYYVQYPDLLVFKDERVKEKMQKANIKKIVATEEYKKIKPENRELFFKYIKLDKKQLDEEYFNNAEKSYLIITGAKPFYENYKEEEYKKAVKQVYDTYKDQYHLIYKPHPSAMPNEEQSAYLKSLNIKILPAKIPMEAITFIYKDIKLGGFGSSLYMSAKEDSTLFFFAEKKEKLVGPLDVLYDQIFSKAEFIK